MSETQRQHRGRFATGFVVGFGLAVLLGLLAYKVQMPSYERAQDAYYEKACRSACEGCEPHF
jgi:hypothetical protein